VDRAAEQAELRDLGDQLAREALLLEALADDRNHLVVDELAD
jgi:hypothetical protein